MRGCVCCVIQTSLWCCVSFVNLQGIQWDKPCDAGISKCPIGPSDVTIYHQCHRCEDTAAESGNAMESKPEVGGDCDPIFRGSWPRWIAKAEVVFSPVCGNGGFHILHEMRFQSTTCFLFQVLRADLFSKISGDVSPGVEYKKWNSCVFKSWEAVCSPQGLDPKFGQWLGLSRRMSETTTNSINSILMWSNQSRLLSRSLNISMRDLL